MDENDLLLRHAERWAAERRRDLDVDLVREALQLRSAHDGLAANRWPARTVTHLLLVRWPAQGSLEPDVPVLLASLETFWRFLRNTGRLAAGSAEPTALVGEAKSAGRRMAAACADPANFGPSKQMLAFGREIGITLDDLDDMDEANERLQRIMNAWNSLPTEERQRRSGSMSNAGSRVGQALGEAAGQLQRDGELPAGWAMPEPARLDEDPGDEPVYPVDPAVSAPQYRASTYLRQVLALCEWVGEGREATATEVLRPAVAKQAYADLGLWTWERDWLVATGMELPRGRRMDEILSQIGLSVWRSAADCLALDRLWLPALSTGLIVIRGKKAVFDRGAVPTTDEGWARLAQMLLLALAHRAGPESAFDPLLSVLLAIAWRAKRPHSPAELADLWWSSPANWASQSRRDPELARRLSDRHLQGCLAMFGDTGAWVVSRGKLTGTDIGWDLGLVVVTGLDAGVLSGPD